MEQFHDWGEAQFIEHLLKKFPAKNTIIGIGDDCAVIPGEQGKEWLVTTDALVEGIHFLKEQISARDLGYKAVAVNISDITAMGGEPKYLFLSLAFPKNVDPAWVYELVEGIKDGCDKWGLFLLGGDTVGSKRDLFLSLTLLGSGAKAKLKFREQAMAGDILCVTGYLGDSGGGFRALQEQIAKTEDVQSLIKSHCHPEPQPKQGKWLASQKAVHAMMDISDGLNCDLSRLVKCSQSGAEIETANIPISAPLYRVSQENGWDPLELALTGGEDYCLLLTVAPEAFGPIQQSFREQFGSLLFEIGCITENSPEIIYHNRGKTIQIDYTNFKHF